MATSDSVVTAYLYDGAPLDPTNPQSVTVVGFVQLFITRQYTNGDIEGVILGVAGCASSDTDCDPGAIKGSSMLPIRLITPAGG